MDNEVKPSFPVTTMVVHRVSVDLRPPDKDGAMRNPTIGTVRKALELLAGQIPLGVDYFLELGRPGYVEASWSSETKL